MCTWTCVLFFFNDTATTEIYTLSLHDALPILAVKVSRGGATLLTDAAVTTGARVRLTPPYGRTVEAEVNGVWTDPSDRKSTRLNSSHANISYAVFCLKKKREGPKVQ